MTENIVTPAGNKLKTIIRNRDDAVRSKVLRRYRTDWGAGSVSM